MWIWPSMDRSLCANILANCPANKSAILVEVRHSTYAVILEPIAITMLNTAGPAWRTPTDSWIEILEKHIIWPSQISVYYHSLARRDTAFMSRDDLLME